MFISFSKKFRSGFTLVEVLVACALFSLAGLAIMSLYNFSTRSFASLANYAQLDQMNRQAMDILTAELRGAYYINDVNITNDLERSLNFITTNSNPRAGAGPLLSITYIWGGNTLTRQANDSLGDLPQVQILTNCQLVEFVVKQKTPLDGQFDIYPPSTENWADEVKVVRLKWKTSHPIPGGPGLTENIQTAQVVIRQQGNVKPF